MKNQIAHCSKWSIPVKVDSNGNVFLQPKGTIILLPFTTEEKYTLLDVPDLHSSISKLIFAEKRIEVLTKQVEQNYSSDYLEKFFKERKIDTPEFYIVQAIVNHYSDFLEEIVLNTGLWSKRNNELNSNKELSYIERDTAKLEMFMEYLKEKS